MPRPEDSCGPLPGFASRRRHGRQPRWRRAAVEAPSSHRGVASLSATLLRTSAANFSFASEPDSCRGGKERMRSGISVALA